MLEAELMPGDGALTAPDWLPWAERLAEYQAAQAALAAEGLETDDLVIDQDEDEDLDDVDDLDAVDFDNDGSPILHSGDVDGVDIDELSDDAADAIDEPIIEDDAEDESDEEDSDDADFDEDDSDDDDFDDDESDDDEDDADEEDSDRSRLGRADDESQPVDEFVHEPSRRCARMSTASGSSSHCT